MQPDTDAPDASKYPNSTRVTPKHDATKVRFCGLSMVLAIPTARLLRAKNKNGSRLVIPE